jgi:hypothetical protein
VGSDRDLAFWTVSSVKLHATEVGLMFPANQTIGNCHIFTVSVFVIRLSAHLSIQSKLRVVLTSIKSITGNSSLSPSNVICEFRFFPVTWRTDRNPVITFEIALSRHFARKTPMVRAELK